MTSSFRPAAGRYRMPTVFGPSAGPRQGRDGAGFDMSHAPRTTTTVSFLTDADRLARLLPARCTLDGEPVVTVEHSVLHELEWLAGRGYSLLGVKFPVRYDGPGESLRGPFLSVLWENRVEPILTGREELGYPKVYCELPPARVLRGERHLAASWEGHTFIEMQVGELQDAAPPAPSGADGILLHRYFPAVEPEQAPSVDEMVMSPLGASPTRCKTYRRGTGCVEFVRSTWEQLPTMFHIVNALHELPVVRMLGGSVSETVGAKDLSDTRVLR